jgi:cytochrome c biogenesis protein CcdA/glutaredoxin
LSVFVPSGLPAGTRKSTHRPSWIWTSLLLLLLAGSAISQTASEPSPIHLYVFLSKTCPHCEIIEAPSLKKLEAKLDCRIVPHYFDVDDLEEYKRLVVLEKRMGDTGNDLPVVVLAGRVLGGTTEIEKQLEGILTDRRLTGAAEITVPTREEADAELRPATATSQKMLLVYFEEPGCKECARAERILKLAESRYPLLEVRRFCLKSRQDHLLLEALSERTGIEEKRRLVTPVIFMGDAALVREEVTDEAVEALCTRYAPTGSRDITTLSPSELDAAENRLWERARNISMIAVAFGGLADGVNPCAFATLVFFICCLAGAGKDRKTILSAGAGFTAGVFVTYFLTGVGLSEVLLRLEFLPLVSTIVTWTIIGLVFILGIVSLWDFILALRGKAGEMRLKLPDRLRMKINALIARRMRARSVLLAAVGLGVTISLLEFVCTGQVYLPLIRFMTTVTGDRVRGLGLLLIYNIGFILPLAAVFAATFFGLQSDRLTSAFKRHLPAGKLLLAVFFLALGVLLLHLQLRGVF